MFSHRIGPRTLHDIMIDNPGVGSKFLLASQVSDRGTSVAVPDCAAADSDVIGGFCGI